MKKVIITTTETVMREIQFDDESFKEKPTTLQILQDIVYHAENVGLERISTVIDRRLGEVTTVLISSDRTNTYDYNDIEPIQYEDKG
jgi:DNA-binding protein YbaB